MVLVIGGIASGKRAYVKSAFGYADGDMSDTLNDNKPVVCNVQALVFSGAVPYPELLAELLKKEVVICNEVGSGVVPIDKAERAAREATGRLCVELAEKAEKVVRVYCGIPSVIKGGC